MSWWLLAARLLALSLLCPMGRLVLEWPPELLPLTREAQLNEFALPVATTLRPQVSVSLLGGLPQPARSQEGCHLS